MQWSAGKIDSDSALCAGWDLIMRAHFAGLRYLADLQLETQTVELNYQLGFRSSGSIHKLKLLWVLISSIRNVAPCKWARRSFPAKLLSTTVICIPTATAKTLQLQQQITELTTSMLSRFISAFDLIELVYVFAGKTLWLSIMPTRWTTQLNNSKHVCMSLCVYV